MWVAEVPVPVTVSVYTPGAVDAVVLTVMAELPPEVTDDGAKLTVTPEGAFAAESWTVCAEPLVVPVATVAVAEEPGSTVPEEGAAEREKSLTGTPVPTACFHRVYAMPSDARLRPVSLTLAVVSQDEW